MIGRRILGGGIGRRLFSRSSLRLNLAQPVKKTGLKGLMQEYGYSALGVYLAIGCIDLPLCYLLVSFTGEEKIGEYEEKVKKFLGFGKNSEKKEGDEKEVHHSSVWTTFAIAYGLHKSLIFVRLPIAAAITPTVVSKLRSMGFNIGNNQFKTIASNAKDSYIEHGLRKSVTTKGVKQIIKSSKLDTEPIQGPKPDFGKPPTRKQKWWSWFF